MSNADRNVLALAYGCLFIASIVALALVSEVHHPGWRLLWLTVIGVILIGTSDRILKLYEKGQKSSG